MILATNTMSGSGSATAVMVMITISISRLIVECYGETAAKFPAILAFGDSTVDTGNNNYIVTPIRGDHPPYGLDFPGRIPTGRFSNGKLVPDILASIIGLKETLPPFFTPNLSDQDLRTGVSFASAGSGYDDLTAALSHVIPVSKQPRFFNTYIHTLERIVGQKQAATIVSTSLVIISAGTNDFIFNFYDIPTRKIQFTVEEYQNFLLTKLRNVVKELYDLGCRKMVVSGIPPIGCLPIQMTAKSPILRRCSSRENRDAQSYNKKLERLVAEMERELGGSRILYVDVYNPVMDMMDNPVKYGFVESRRGCCGSGVLEAGPLCTRLTPLCSNPSQYLFYDSIHPSQSA